MKLSLAHLATLAIVAPVAIAFTTTSSRSSSSSSGIVGVMNMAKLDDSLADKQKQQEADLKAFLEDPTSTMNTDAFVDNMEEQKENLAQYQKEESGADIVNKKMRNLQDNIKMPSIKMDDISSKVQNWKDSVDEEQVKEFMGKAGDFSKNAWAFSKNAFEESIELAKQAKANMGTTQVGKDKDTTYEDALNKMGKAGMGVWSLMKDLGGFVQEKAQKVDVDGLKASAESTLANLKTKTKKTPPMDEEI